MVVVPLHALHTIVAVSAAFLLVQLTNMAIGPFHSPHFLLILEDEAGVNQEHQHEHEHIEGSPVNQGLLGQLGDRAHQVDEGHGHTLEYHQPHHLEAEDECWVSHKDYLRLCGN